MVFQTVEMVVQIVKVPEVVAVKALLQGNLEKAPELYMLAAVVVPVIVIAVLAAPEVAAVVAPQTQAIQTEKIIPAAAAAAVTAFQLILEKAVLVSLSSASIRRRQHEIRTDRGRHRDQRHCAERP